MDEQNKIALWSLPKLDVTQFQHLNLEAIPATSQQTILLYDLIYSLTGIQGTYITPEEIQNGDNYKIQFKISDGIDTSTKNLIEEMLPLASNFLYIQKFISESSESYCGQVLQALSAALRQICNDYFMLMSQLETELDNGKLTFHSIFYYTRPIFEVMELVAGILNEITVSKIKGGGVISLLYNKIDILRGREELQKILINLTQKAAVPYMNMLQLWIQKGFLNDVQQEFLIQDNEVIRYKELPEHYSANYWDKKYTLRTEAIPKFLEKVSDIILRTGKYLNVIKQCGKNISNSDTMNIQFSTSNNSYITAIHDAYNDASKSLLEVLMKENDLMGHIMSVKGYLLFSQGDFITQFMDDCEEELSKSVDKVLPMKLENLFGLSLRLSSANNDPYKDEWHCQFLTNDLVTQINKIMMKNYEYIDFQSGTNLTGLECFALQYNVKWPISLVLNHIAMCKYQMLFRQLFYLKHVERQLCKIWKDNVCAAKKFPSNIAEKLKFAFALRQKMMNAIQNIQHYMMIEVIEPNFHIFKTNIRNVKNLDELLQFHQNFLDQCIQNCMLQCPDVLMSIIKLCKVCLYFCNLMQKYGLSNEFLHKINQCNVIFTKILIELLKQIKVVAFENLADRCIHLVHRINFNLFYTAHMDSSTEEKEKEDSDEFSDG